MGSDAAVVTAAKRLGASDILLEPFSAETLRGRLQRRPLLRGAA